MFKWSRKKGAFVTPGIAQEERSDNTDIIQKDVITTPDNPEVPPPDAYVTLDLPENAPPDALDKPDALVASETGDELSEPAITKAKKMPWSTKKIVIMSIVGALLFLIVGGSSYAYSIWNNPMGQFESITQQMAAPPSEALPAAAPDGTETTDVAEMTAMAKTTEAAETAETTDTAAPGPTLTPETLVTQSDFSNLDNIVNIMLIGVDHAVERETWSGKHAYHSDVMIVLSINTKTRDVSMISLPRDTYAKIPGVEGIYKLNASIDCGGGWPTESGFQKVCESAEWMLGGIPIDYYYAVDMGAVKDLVNAIGGVDFDIDVAFKMQGRSYKKGMQHLDGQAVLDYLRVRKNIEDGRR